MYKHNTVLCLPFKLSRAPSLFLKTTFQNYPVDPDHSDTVVGGDWAIG